MTSLFLDYFKQSDSERLSDFYEIAECHFRRLPGGWVIRNWPTLHTRSSVGLELVRTSFASCTMETCEMKAFTAMVCIFATNGIWLTNPKSSSITISK